jgi:ankyrin repeat protein
LVERKKIEFIDCLLSLGADINAKCDYNVTSLHEAIRLKNIQAVKILAKLGLAATVPKRETGVTALFMAVEQGLKEVMKQLVHSGADVNASYRRIPVLHDAVQSGIVEIVETLFEYGVKTNAVKCFKITPVNHAALVNVTDLGIYTCLANLGADLDLPCTASFAVHEAVTLQKPDVLNCLAHHCCLDPSATMDSIPPILNLLIKDKFEMLEHIVQCGADMNVQFAEVCPMVECIQLGNARMIEALVDHGLGFEVYVKSQETLLSYLITSYMKQFGISKMTRALKVLLGCGADVNVICNIAPVFHDAVARSDVHMVKMFGRLGADVNTLGYRGGTLLIRVLFTKYLQFEEFDLNLIKCLVQAGANVNCEFDSIRPLFLAIRHSDVKMVEALAELGADMNGVMVKGFKPVHLICRMDTKDILQFLVDNGADVNAEAEFGVEPLLEALQLYDVEMILCLLQCGANPHVGKSYRKWGLIDCSIEGGEPDILTFLIKAGFSLEASEEYIPLRHILGEGIVEIAENYGIHIKKQPKFSVFTKYLLNGWDCEMVPILLSHGCNKLCGTTTEWITAEHRINSDIFHNVWCTVAVEEEHTYSNLHAACIHGELDTARLLILDGSDVNERDSHGKLPFECLPLVSSIGYHTLYETRTTQKVIQRVGHDFEQFLLCGKMEALLCTPGLGDVQCIEGENANEIFGEVLWAVCKIVESLQLMTTSKIRLISVGSAAEGAKVCLPDEMDFLAEVADLEEADQVYMKDTGHGFVHYDNPADHVFIKRGSKKFHVEFAHRLIAAVEAVRCLFNSDCLHVSSLSHANMIKDVKRGATSPLRMVWYGKSKGSNRVTISVDIVPCLHINGWPRGGVSRTWLLDRNELRQYGYYLVTKPPHVNSDLAKQYTAEELPNLWKMSFSHLETYHMQRLEKRIKDVYVLAKCLRNPDVCRLLVTDEGSWPKNADKYITSYMLKMIFFKNVEDFLHSDLGLGEMVCRVYDAVEEGLSQGFIPLFFMPEVNALGGLKLNIAKCARVAKIMKKFVHALYIRDCQLDGNVICDVEEAVVYQRKRTSVYRSIEIGNSVEEMPKVGRDLVDPPSGRYLAIDQSLDELFDWKCGLL